jgi:hypothetical protein
MVKHKKEKCREWYCHRCGTNKNVYKKWIEEAEEFDDNLIRTGRIQAMKLVEIWLNDFVKLVDWHKIRSMLPYDWHDYEHKKLMELNILIKELK